MKLLLTAVLVGAVAAFAPACTTRPALSPSPQGSSTQLEMKVAASLGSAKRRSKTCQVIKRRGRYYVIDKKNPRNKARQGGAKMKAWMKCKK